MTPASILLPLALSLSQQANQDSALVAELAKHAVPITVTADGLSGAGADSIHAAIKRSQFILIGEDHGFADLDWLTGHVFRAAHSNDFAHLAIENGPIATREVTKMLSAPDGVAGVRRFLRDHPWSIAFAMEEDLALYAAAVKSAGPGALWGLDQEFAGSPPFLLHRLAELSPNAAAKALAQELATKAVAADRRMITEKNPGLMYPSTATPDELDRLQRAFASTKSAEAREIVDELVRTIDIYPKNNQGQGYRSGFDRVALMKSHFMRDYRAAQARGERIPRVVFRFGANHILQGANFTGHYDLGTFAKELAPSNGLAAYNVLVLVAGGEHNRYLPFIANEADKHKPYQPLEDIGPYAAPFLAAAEPEGALISLADLRGRANSGRLGALSRNLERVLMGFDAVLIIPKGHAATLIE
jgi:hypothetical protein